MRDCIIKVSSHSMKHAMRAVLRIAALVIFIVGFGAGTLAPQANPQPSGNQYSANEVLDAGHRFFGTVSRGLAEIVEKAGSQWGLPNGYVLGQEVGRRVLGGSPLRRRHALHQEHRRF